MLRKLLLHSNIIVRFMSLAVIGALLFLAAWALSYMFLPEGILRGRLGSQALAGETAASTFLLEFLRIAGLNLTIGFFLVVLPSLLKDERGIPFSYFIPLAWAVLYAVLLGTNSFTFPLPGGKMAPTLAVLTRSGPYELSAFLLVAASLYAVARYQLKGTWPRQTLVDVAHRRPASMEWLGIALGVLLLLAANAWEAYLIVNLG